MYHSLGVQNPYPPQILGRDTSHWTKGLKAPFNLALNTDRDMGINSLSGQNVPVFHHLHN